MSLFRDTTYRSEELELMDDFSIQGDLLRDTLDQLGRINKWLGGNRITLDGIRALLNGQSKKRKFTIVDLGCGHGDMLRKVADFGRANGYQFKLIGIDANVDAIAYANQLSQSYEEISYLSWDIFSDEFKALRCDMVLCTLFLHHFSDSDIIDVLKQSSYQTSLGIVINDLQRSKIAYVLFCLLGIVISNYMVKKDGLTSILRAFKKSEIVKISEQLGLPFSIKWRWAFRYQWIINTTTQ